MAKLKLEEPVGERDELYTVVAADGLGPATESGWRLVQILDEEHIEAIDEPMSHEEREALQRRGGFSGVDAQGKQVPWGVVRRMVVVRQRRYLLKRDTASALAESAARVAAVEARASALAEQLRKTTLAHEATAEVLAREQAMRTTLVKDVDRLTGISTTLQQTLRRMESDLGKVRHAVGELKMKEILGS